MEASLHRCDEMSVEEAAQGQRTTRHPTRLLRPTGCGPNHPARSQVCCGAAHLLLRSGSYSNFPPRRALQRRRLNWAIRIRKEMSEALTTQGSQKRTRSNIRKPFVDLGWSICGSRGSRIYVRVSRADGRSLLERPHRQR
jgi:hypothetical protein